jgi:hypothetical protein
MLGCREIAKLSGISKSLVADLSLKTTWRNVSAGVIEKFTVACGVDLLRPWKTVAQLRHSKQYWITRAGPQQKAMLMKIYKLEPASK